MLGFSRPQSAKISFLLSVPIITGAAALKLKDISYADINVAFAAGFFTALIGGWLVIKFLMKYLQTHTFDLFVYYRWFLGAIIIGFHLLRG
jgi:undecaprenyl-diphosphatase